MTGAETLIGKTGTAISDLKPKGEVRVAGEIWHAESLSGDIANGEKVCVKALNGLVLEVEKIHKSEPPPSAS